MSLRHAKLAALSSGVAALALVYPATALADTVTVTRACADLSDPACVVQLAAVAAAPVVAVAGPSTALGPAIELNVSVAQVADAGAAPPAGGGALVGATQSSGLANNTFDISLGQSGTATATSGSASNSASGAQASSSTATQNAAPSAAGDQAPPNQSPPGGGSGINMITNVASVVQLVQIVAHNTSNTTIAPVQAAQQCQQAAVSCSGSPNAGH